MQRLLVLGLNHTTAPLAVRERLSFNPQQQREAIAAFQARFPHAEIVLLSTCNRIELYTARPVHGHPRIEQVIEFLAEFQKIEPAEFSAHLYTHSEVEVVRHLFSVACSLDSMVLGETQILGQVRGAYDTALACKSAGALLHPLFQRAVAVGKQVMRDTALSEGRVSVASVAVDYARRIFETFGDKTVLTIGAGKMATLALTNFRMLRPGRLLVCNRDPAKAQRLAAEFGGTPVAYEGLADHLAAADVVITSTGAMQPIITRKMFEAILPRRRYRTIFLIDIALPRDIEAGVGELDNVYLYNLDDLQQVVAATHQQRAGAVNIARAIIEQQIQEFLAWNRAREMGPLIERLYRRAQEIAQEELSRYLNRAGPVNEQQRAMLEDLTRRIVNKLLHQPVQTLRDTDGLRSPVTASAMEKLFGLEADSQAGGEEASGAQTLPPQGADNGPKAST